MAPFSVPGRLYMDDDRRRIKNEKSRQLLVLLSSRRTWTRIKQDKAPIAPIARRASRQIAPRGSLRCLWSGSPLGKGTSTLRGSLLMGCLSTIPHLTGHHSKADHTLPGFKGRKALLAIWPICPAPAHKKISLWIYLPIKV